MLQRLLITGRVASPLRFRRLLTLDRKGLTIRDEIEGSGEIIAAGVGPAQTSIYTVMSRVYHRSQLQPWSDLDDHVDETDKRIEVTRRLETGA